MAYKALYRTYRPRTFAEVAGQQPIVKTLENALKTNKIAHAYLFCGPRGTGKTTMARLLAKALNCSEGMGHQCNHCSNCLEIDEGIHPDVIEIDAASNNGIDQVRDLIEKVNYLPIKGKYKVYIIDEVHNMSDNAFNALLKTLEEPPSHVIFVLATTEPHNILPTIVSRCQRYDFTKVAEEDIYAKLCEILEKENVTYEKEAVKAITTLADGGLRDALSMLDQILAYSNQSLIEEDVYMLFGLASKKEKIDFLLAIHNGDIVLALSKIQSFVEGGVDLKRLVSDLLEILKDILIYSKNHDEELLTTLSEKEAQMVSQELTIKECNTLVEQFLKMQGQLRSVSNTRTLLELVTIRLCTNEETVIEKPAKITFSKQNYTLEEKNIDETKITENVVKTSSPNIIKETKQDNLSEAKIDDIKVPEEVATEEVTVTTFIEEKDDNPKPTDNEQKQNSAPDWLFEDDTNTDKLTINKNVDGEKNHLDDQDIIGIMVKANKLERQTLEEKWYDLDRLISDPNIGEIAALLKDGSPFILSKEILVLVYDFAKLADRVNIPANQTSLSMLVKKMLKRQVAVYAISRSESVRLRKVFFNLRQINQLPDAATIKLDINKIKR